MRYTKNMKLKFLGAAGTVTGSSYILTSGSGQSILIDFGLFLGPRDIDTLNYQPYEYDCSQLTGAVLTHAHLDHCGRLPILLPQGYRGDILMTPATQELTQVSQTVQCTYPGGSGTRQSIWIPGIYKYPKTRSN